MKTLRVLTLLTIFLSLFAMPASAQAAPAAFAPFDDDTVIFGQDFTLSEGQTVDGSLVAFGSRVIIEEGATIDADFVAFGSDIQLDGEVQRDFIALGSTVNLGDSASIGRDFIAPGTSWNRGGQAVIGGDIISESGPFVVDLEDFLGPNGLNFGDGIDINPPRVSDVGIRFDPINDAVWLMFRSIALATLALFVVLFLPVPTHRILKSINDQPVNSIGAGFLGSILLPIAVVVLAITICLIPFALLLAFAAVVAFTFGMIALGLEVGRRLMDALKGDWTEAVQAWVGTFLLNLVVGIIAWVPCVGWLGSFFIMTLGFGAVILTRFGTQDYPLETAIVEAEPAKAPAKKTTRKSSKKS